MSKVWWDKHRVLKRVISLTALFTFVVSFVLSDAWAVVGQDAFNSVSNLMREEESGPSVFDVETFALPGHLGEIKHIYKGSSNKVVLHIQDAHANCYAQEKISGIIDYLNIEYGADLINLEGGAGEYDLHLFSDIQGPQVRKEVTEYFVKKGDISGAEAFAINYPDRVTLWGVENKELYLENLKVYRDSLSYRTEVDGYLAELTHVFNNLKRHIYTPELLKLDIEYNAYKSGNLEFREYFIFLVKTARDRKIDLKNFKDLYLLQQAMSKEGSIDFKRADMQRNVLIDELKNILSQSEIKELIANTVSFRTRRISRKDFYGYLLSKGAEVGLEEKRFKELSDYLEYVTIYEAIDQAEVMREMEDLEASIKEPLYQNDIQRRLDTLSRDLTLLKNIFSIKITKPDYIYYLENRAGFDIRNFLDFVGEEAPKYRIQAEFTPGIEKLDDYRERISRFYEYSFERDDAFLENMKFSGYRGLSNGKQVAVLMTGGFHTENICELLQKQGVSCVSIVPKFRCEEGYESPYFELLAGQRGGFEKMIGRIIASASTMALASRLSPILADSIYPEAERYAFEISIRVVRDLIAENGLDWLLENENKLVIENQDGMLVCAFGEESLYANPLSELLAGAGYEAPEAEIDVRMMAPAIDAGVSEEAQEFKILASAYNEGKVIREVLEKAREAGYIDRLVIVNDGSTDDTGDILDEYAQYGLTVIHKTNSGKPDSMKYALNLLKEEGQLPEYVVTTDADSFFQVKSGSAGSIVDNLTRAVAHSRTNDLAAVALDITPTMKRGSLLEHMQAIKWKLTNNYLRYIGQSVSGAGGLYRSSALLSAMDRHSGRFNAEDPEIVSLIRRDGGKIGKYREGIEVRTDIPRTWGTYFSQYKRYGRGFIEQFGFRDWRTSLAVLSGIVLGIIAVNVYSSVLSPGDLMLVLTHGILFKLAGIVYLISAVGMLPVISNIWRDRDITVTQKIVQSAAAPAYPVFETGAIVIGFFGGMADMVREAIVKRSGITRSKAGFIEVPEEIKTGFLFTTLAALFTGVGATFIAANVGPYMLTEAVSIGIRMYSAIFVVGVISLAGYAVYMRGGDRAKSIGSIIMASTFLLFLLALPRIASAKTTYKPVMPEEARPMIEQIEAPAAEPARDRALESFEKYNIQNEKQLTATVDEIVRIVLGENIVSIFMAKTPEARAEITGDITESIMTRYLLAKETNGFKEWFIKRSSRGKSNESLTLQDALWPTAYNCMFETLNGKSLKGEMVDGKWQRGTSFYHIENWYKPGEAGFDKFNKTIAEMRPVIIARLLKKDPKIVQYHGDKMSDAQVLKQWPNKELELELERSHNGHDYYSFKPEFLKGVIKRTEVAAAKKEAVPAGSWFEKSRLYTKYVASWFETIVSFAPVVGVIGSLFFLGVIPILAVPLLPVIAAGIFYFGHGEDMRAGSAVQRLTRLTFGAALLAAIPLSFGAVIYAAVTLGIVAIPLIAYHQKINLRVVSERAPPVGLSEEELKERVTAVLLDVFTGPGEADELYADLRSNYKAGDLVVLADDPAVQEVLGYIGGEEDVRKRLEKEGIIFTRAPPLADMDKAISLDQSPYEIALEVYEKLKLAHKWGEFTASEDQPKDFLTENFFNSPLLVVRTMRNVTGDKSIALSDLTGNISLDLHSEEGKHKDVYKLFFTMSDGTVVEGTFDLAYKEGKFTGGISEEEVSELELLRELGFDFIPRFGHLFRDDEGNIIGYIEEFVPGETAWSLKWNERGEEGKLLTLEHREKIVEAILRTGKALGGIPQDFHGRNFIVGDKISFIDIGKKRIQLLGNRVPGYVEIKGSEALSLVTLLIGYYGFSRESGIANEFVFERIERIYPEGRQIIKEARKYSEKLKIDEKELYRNDAATDKMSGKDKGWIKTPADLSYMLAQVDQYIEDHPEGGKPGMGSAVVGLLKRLTPGLGEKTRSLAVAPIVEEGIFRWLIPFFTLGILSFIGFEGQLLVAGLVISYMISGITFVLLHLNGERSPPDILRAVSAPIIVTVITAFFVPLVLSNPLLFMGLSVASHAIVNAGVLFLNKALPDSRLGIATIGEAEKELLDKAEKLLEEGRKEEAEEIIFSLFPEEKRTAIRESYAGAASTIHEGEEFKVTAEDLLFLAGLYVNSTGTRGADRIEYQILRFCEHPHLLIPLRQHKDHIRKLGGHVWSYFTKLYGLAIENDDQVYVPGAMLNSYLVNDEYIGLISSVAEKLDAQDNRAYMAFNRFLYVIVGQSDVLADPDGAAFLLQNSEKLLTLSSGTLVSYLSEVFNYQSNTRLNFFEEGAGAYLNPLLTEDALAYISQNSGNEETAAAVITLMTMNTMALSVFKEEGLLEDLLKLSPEKQSDFVKAMQKTGIFEAQLQEDPDFVTLDTLRFFLKKELIEIYAEHGDLAQPLFKILKEKPEELQKYSLGSEGLKNFIDLSRAGIIEEYLLMLRRRETSFLKASLNSSPGSASPMILEKIGDRTFIDALIDMAGLDTGLAKIYINIVAETDPLDAAEALEALTGEYRDALSKVPPDIRQRFFVSEKGSYQTAGAPSGYINVMRVLAGLSSVEAVDAFRTRLSDSVFLDYIRSDGSSRLIEKLANNPERQVFLIENFEPSMMESDNPRTIFLEKVQKNIQNAELAQDMADIIADNPAYTEYFSREENFEFLLNMLKRSKNFAQAFMELVLMGGAISGKGLPVEQLGIFIKNYEQLLLDRTKGERFVFMVMYLMNHQPSLMGKISIEKLERLYAASPKTFQDYCYLIVADERLRDGSSDIGFVLSEYEGEYYENIIALIKTDEGREDLKEGRAYFRTDYSRKEREEISKGYGGVYLVEPITNRRPYGWELADIYMRIFWRDRTNSERFIENIELFKAVHPDILDSFKYFIKRHLEKGRAWEDLFFLREDILKKLGQINDPLLGKMIVMRYEKYLEEGNEESIKQVESIFENEELFQALLSLPEGRGKVIYDSSTKERLGGKALIYLILSQEDNKFLQDALIRNEEESYYESLFSPEFFALKQKVLEKLGEKFLDAMMKNATSVSFGGSAAEVLEKFLKDDFLDETVKNIDLIFGESRRQIVTENITPRLFRVLVLQKDRIEKTLSMMKDILGGEAYEDFLDNGDYKNILNWSDSFGGLTEGERSKLKEQVQGLPPAERNTYISLLTSLREQGAVRFLLRLTADQLVPWLGNPNALKEAVALHGRFYGQLYQGVEGYSADDEQLIYKILIMNERNLIYDLQGIYDALRLGSIKAETLRKFLEMGDVDVSSKKGKRIIKEKVKALKQAFKTAGLLNNIKGSREMRKRVAEAIVEVNESLISSLDAEKVSASLEGIYNGFIRTLISDVTGAEDIPDDLISSPQVIDKIMTLVSLYYSLDRYGKVQGDIKNMLTMYVSSGGDSAALRANILEREANRREIKLLASKGYSERLWNEGFTFKAEALPVAEEERIKEIKNRIVSTAHELVEIAQRIEYLPEGTTEEELAETLFANYEEAKSFVDKMKKDAKKFDLSSENRCAQILEKLEALEGSIALKEKDIKPQEVTIVIKKDFLTEASVGMSAFSECFSADNGCNRHMPPAHAMEANAFMGVVYDSEGTMIGNVVLVLTDHGLLPFGLYTSRQDLNLDALWLGVWSKLVNDGIVPAVILPAIWNYREPAGRRAAIKLGEAEKEGKPAISTKRHTLWSQMYYDSGDSNSNGDHSLNTAEAIWIEGEMSKEELRLAGKLVDAGEEGPEEVPGEVAEEETVAFSKSERKQITEEMFSLRKEGRPLDVEMRPLLSDVDGVILTKTDEELEAILNTLTSRQNRGERAPPEDVAILRQKLRELREEHQLNKAFDILEERLLKMREEGELISFEMAQEVLQDIITTKFGLDLDITQRELTGNTVDIGSVSPQIRVILSQVDQHLQREGPINLAKQPVERSRQERLFGEYVPTRGEILMHGEITIDESGEISINFVPREDSLSIYDQDVLPEGNIVLQFELYVRGDQVRMELVDLIAKRSTNQMLAYSSLESLSQYLSRRLGEEIYLEAETAVFKTRSRWDGEKYVFTPRGRDIPSRIGWERVKTAQSRIKSLWIERIQPKYSFEDMSTSGIDQANFGFYEKRIVPAVEVPMLGKGNLDWAVKLLKRLGFRMTPAVENFWVPVFEETMMSLVLFAGFHFGGLSLAGIIPFILVRAFFVYRHYIQTTQAIDLEGMTPKEIFLRKTAVPLAASVAAILPLAFGLLPLGLSAVTVMMLSFSLGLVTHIAGNTAVDLFRRNYQKGILREDGEISDIPEEKKAAREEVPERAVEEAAPLDSTVIPPLQGVHMTDIAPTIDEDGNSVIESLGVSHRGMIPSFRVNITFNHPVAAVNAGEHSWNRSRYAVVWDLDEDFFKGNKGLGGNQLDYMFGLSVKIKPGAGYKLFETYEDLIKYIENKAAIREGMTVEEYRDILEDMVEQDQQLASHAGLLSKKLRASADDPNISTPERLLNAFIVPLLAWSQAEQYLTERGSYLAGSDTKWQNREMYRKYNEPVMKYVRNHSGFLDDIGTDEQGPYSLIRRIGLYINRFQANSEEMALIEESADFYDYIQRVIEMLKNNAIEEHDSSLKFYEKTVAKLEGKERETELSPYEANELKHNRKEMEFCGEMIEQIKEEAKILKEFYSRNTADLALANLIALSVSTEDASNQERRSRILGKHGVPGDEKTRQEMTNKVLQAQDEMAESLNLLAGETADRMIESDGMDDLESSLNELEEIVKDVQEGREIEIPDNSKAGKLIDSVREISQKMALYRSFPQILYLSYKNPDHLNVLASVLRKALEERQAKPVAEAAAGAWRPEDRAYVEKKAWWFETILSFVPLLGAVAAAPFLASGWALVLVPLVTGIASAAIFYLPHLKVGLGKSNTVLFLTAVTFGATLVVSAYLAVGLITQAFLSFIVLGGAIMYAHRGRNLLRIVGITEEEAVPETPGILAARARLLDDAETVVSTVEDLNRELDELIKSGKPLTYENEKVMSIRGRIAALTPLFDKANVDMIVFGDSMGTASAKIKESMERLDDFNLRLSDAMGEYHIAELDRPRQIAREFLDRIEIEDDAREDMEAILSKRFMTDEDRLIVLFFVIGKNMIAYEKAETREEAQKHKVSQELADRFADMCASAYPETAKAAREYKGDVSDGILMPIRRSLEDLLRALRKEGLLLEIDELNGEVRIGRVTTKEEYPVKMLGKPIMKQVPLWFVEPIVRHRDLAGHGGTYRRELFDVFGPKIMVADTPPVVFMGHSVREVKNMMIMVRDMKDPVRGDRASIRLAKRQFTALGLEAPGIEDIAALRVRGIADHEMTHRLHRMLDMDSLVGTEEEETKIDLPEGIDSEEAYAEMIAFLGWMASGHVFFRLSEALRVVESFAKDPAKKEELENKLGADIDDHLSALNAIIRELAKASGTELAEDMSNIDQVAEVLASLTGEELVGRVKEILLSILPETYGEALLEAVSELANASAYTKYYSAKLYVTDSKWSPQAIIESTGEDMDAVVTKEIEEAEAAAAVAVLPQAEPLTQEAFVTPVGALATAPVLELAGNLKELSFQQLVEVENAIAGEDRGKDFHKAVLGAMLELEGIRARDVMMETKQDANRKVVLMSLPEEQFDLEMSAVKNAEQSTKRVIRKNFVVENIQVVYYRRGDAESFREAAEEAKEGVKEGGPEARLIAFTDQAVEGKEYEDILGALRGELKDQIAGAIKEDIDIEQRQDVTLHVILGLGLMDYVKTGREELLLNIKELLGVMVDNIDEIKDLTPQDVLEKLLNGGILLRIRRIDYEEIRDWKEAEDAVRRSL